ncbi:hypothetical protein BC830DRAFT_881083 [Chytriomyces sp. MP71]|nr:hypothetical protein BC830DRAFT_881083 [Chytriomyces sp. MP71]
MNQQIEFTENDMRFIRAIKSAAFSPTSNVYQNPYSDLVNRGILSRLPSGYAIKPASRSDGSVGPSASARGMDAVRLLKDLGVLAPWENTVLLTNATGGKSTLPSIDGHGFSDWADEAVRCSKLWSERLLRETPVFYADKAAASEPRRESEPDKPIIRSESLERAMNECTITPLDSNAQDNAFIASDAFESQRRDFGDLPVYVIDSPTAQELDDGISVETTPEGVWMHAHIADPTAYLPPAHPLSMLAQLRGTSMYLPERHYPMLPDSLSDARFNLGKSYCAMTFSCRIGSDGEIADFKVAPSIIRNIKILNYRDVNKILEWSNVFGVNALPETRMPWVNKALRDLQPEQKSTTSTSTSIDSVSAKELLEIQQIATRHLQLRISRGGFSSDQPDYSVKVSPYPLPITSQNPLEAFEYKVNQPTPPLVILDANQSSHLEPASNMVSECMIMANRVASKFCTDNRIPAIYRGQEPLKNVSHEERHIIEDALASVDRSSGIMPYMSFRSVLPYFSSATISTSPLCHFSLGIHAGSASSVSEFSGYMKVTSPLRRYKDLLMHWMMKNHILGAPRIFDEQGIMALASRLHEGEKRMNAVSSRSTQFWAMEWVLRREVLWRTGAPESVVYLGVDAGDEVMRKIGIALPSVGTGPRGPVVWGEAYRRSNEWGAKVESWEVTLSSRCLRPTYQVILNSVFDSKSGFGILGDLGGLPARVELKRRRHAGEIVICVVDTVDPAGGVLVVKEE